MTTPVNYTPENTSNSTQPLEVSCIFDSINDLRQMALDIQLEVDNLPARFVKMFAKIYLLDDMAKCAEA